MLLVYRHTLIVLYICLCIACFAGNIVWALLLFGASTSNTSPSSAAAAAPTVASGVGVVVAAAPTVAAATTTTAAATTTTAAAAAATNTSKSTEYIIKINDTSLKLLKGVCIILNVLVIPLLIYFFYSYRKTWW